MASFQFRLEKVWKHRQRIVDQHSQAVAQANRLVADISRKIVKLEGDIARQARSLVTGEGEPLNPRDRNAGTAWLEHLHRQKEDLELQLQTAVKNLERHRSRLLDSWRDLEVLSRLKDKQADSWLAGQEKRLRREMDEIGQVRAFRHRPSKDAP